MIRILNYYLFNIILFMSLSISSGFAYKIYVGNYGDSTISVIDGKSRKVTTTISVNPGPANLVLSPDNRFLYVSSSGTYTLARIDTISNRVVSNIEVGKIPQGGGVDKKGKIVLVAILGTQSIVYVDTKINDVTDKILVGKVQQLALNASNTMAYLGLQDTNQYAIGIFDIAKKAMVKTIDLKNAPKELAVSPQSGNIYFTAVGSDSVQIIDPKSLSIIKEIVVGPSLAGITFTRNGKLGLVVSQNNKTLYTFDPQTNTIKDQIIVDTQPYAIALSPDDKTAFVTNEGANSVSVVDLVDKKVVDTISVGSLPHYIVVSKK